MEEHDDLKTQENKNAKEEDAVKLRKFPESNQDDTIGLGSEDQRNIHVRTKTQNNQIKTDKVRSDETESLTNNQYTDTNFRDHPNNDHDKNDNLDNSVKFEYEVNIDNPETKRESSSQKLGSNSNQEMIVEQEPFQDSNEMKETHIRLEQVKVPHEEQHGDDKFENGKQTHQQKHSEHQGDNTVGISEMYLNSKNQGSDVNRRESSDWSEDIDLSKRTPESIERQDNDNSDNKQYQFSTSEEQSDLGEDNLDSKAQEKDPEENNYQTSGENSNFDDRDSESRTVEGHGQTGDRMLEETDDLKKGLHEETSGKSSQALKEILDTIKEFDNIRKTYERLQNKNLPGEETDKVTNVEEGRHAEIREKENIKDSEFIKKDDTGNFEGMTGKREEKLSETILNPSVDGKNREMANEEKVELENLGSFDMDQGDISPNDQTRGSYDSSKDDPNLSFSDATVPPKEEHKGTV